MSFGIESGRPDPFSLYKKLNRTTPNPRARSAFATASIDLSDMLPPAPWAQTKTAAQDAIAHAFVAGFRAIMLISAALALGGAASAWLLIRSPESNR